MMHKFSFLVVLSFSTVVPLSVSDVLSQSNLTIVIETHLDDADYALTWDEVPDASWYVVQVATESSFGQPLHSKTLSADSRTCNFDGLKLNEDYYFRLGVKKANQENTEWFDAEYRKVLRNARLKNAGNSFASASKIWQGLKGMDMTGFVIIFVLIISFAVVWFRHAVPLSRNLTEELSIDYERFKDDVGGEWSKALFDQHRAEKHKPASLDLSAISSSAKAVKCSRNGSSQNEHSGRIHIEGALVVCDEKEYKGRSISRIIKGGLINHWINYNNPQASEEIDREINKISAGELQNLKKSHLDRLWTFAGVAPLLGLLGTVLGLLIAFAEMVEKLNMKSLKPAEIVPELAKGIYSAVVTTVAGLVIAIIFLYIHSRASSRLDELFRKWSDVSNALTRDI